MAGNPYESPSTVSGSASRLVAASPFPFFSAGPFVGGTVGLTHVAATAGVWAFHGYPDYFFRNADGVWISVALLSFGGAVFGMLYAVLLRFTLKLMSLGIRERLHFYAALFSTVLLTVVNCEMSILRFVSLNPFAVLAAIVAIAFGTALATGERIESES